MSKSTGEELLAFQLKAYGIDHQRELIFHPTRKWRFDFSIKTETLMLAVEVEGGGSRGRHTSFYGFQEDMVKYSEAAKLGWTLLRFTPAQVKKGLAILHIRAFLDGVTIPPIAIAKKKKRKPARRL